MKFVSTWDSGLKGATYDVGLQWDVNVGPSIGDVSAYLKLIPSQHRNKPNFLAVLNTLLQPLCDCMAAISLLPAAFDIDDAVGQQIDITGQWIGETRYLKTPLTGVYFAFDTPGLGFDQGTWSSPFQPTTQFVALSDDQYRLLLRAKIANNHWDGTAPGAYQIFNSLFAGTGFGILIQDTANMHMVYALTGTVPDIVTFNLFIGGYLNIKPAGVKIDAFLTPTVPDAPYFGFDVDNASIGGFDHGAWGAISPGS